MRIHRLQVSCVARFTLSFFIFSLIFGGQVVFASEISSLLTGVKLDSKVSSRVGNIAPVADSQVLTLPRNTTQSITLTGTDPDSPGLGFLISSKPKNGRLDGWSKVPEGIEITYTPSDDWSGTDSFTFAVSDSGSTSAPAKVTLIVIE